MRFWMHGAAVLVWVVVLGAAFFPGLMSTDTLDMIRMGSDGTYTTDHPPLLSFIIARTVGIFGSPWPLFALQLIALGTGMALLNFRRPWAGLAILCAFLWTPPVWSTAVALWKDVALAATLLWVVVALLHGRPWMALALAVVSGLMRHNAITASLPLMAAAGSVLAVSQLRRALLVLAGALATVIVIDATHRAFSARDDWKVKWIVGHDLAAMYVERPDLLASSVLASQLTVDDLRANYNPSSVVYLYYWGKPGTHTLGPDWMVEHRPEVTAEWRRAIVQHPVLYLRTRLNRFARLMGFDEPAVHYPFHEGIDSNPYGWKLRSHNDVYRALRVVQTKVRDTFLFRGWFWASLLLVFTIISVLRRDGDALPAWIGLSGLGYLAGYVLTTPASDFRYLFWSIVALFAGLSVSAASDSRGRATARV